MDNLMQNLDYFQSNVVLIINPSKSFIILTVKHAYHYKQYYIIHYHNFEFNLDIFYKNCDNFFVFYFFSLN